MRLVPSLTAKELATDGLLSALLFICQVSFSWIANVELVSLLLILYALVFRKHVWLILYVFVVLEGLFYGFGLWWFSYLYVWALLAAGVFLFFRNGPPHTFSVALLSGTFGMVFGLLCAFSYLLTGGPGAALGWWIAGIPFDIIHGISNFFLALILFRPMYRLLTALKHI